MINVSLCFSDWPNGIDFTLSSKDFEVKHVENADLKLQLTLDVSTCTVKTVICDLQLDLDKKVAYDRGSFNTMSIRICKRFWAN